MMKAGTIILLLFLVAIVAACSRTDTQGNDDTSADTTGTGEATLVIEDPSIEEELISDPLEEIGALDEMPVDDSIPE